MKRYRHDPNVPSHLRKLVESARVDDLDANRRRLVAERLGIASVAGLPSEPSRESSSARARASVPFGAIALTAIALIGGTVTYVAVSHPSPAESPRAAVSLAVPPPPPTSIVEPPPARACGADIDERRSAPRCAPGARSHREANPRNRTRTEGGGGGPPAGNRRPRQRPSRDRRRATAGSARAPRRLRGQVPHGQASRRGAGAAHRSAPRERRPDGRREARAAAPSRFSQYSLRRARSLRPRQGLAGAAMSRKGPRAEVTYWCRGAPS